MNKQLPNMLQHKLFMFCLRFNLLSSDNLFRLFFMKRTRLAIKQAITSRNLQCRLLRSSTSICGSSWRKIRLQSSHLKSHVLAGHPDKQTPCFVAIHPTNQHIRRFCCQPVARECIPGCHIDIETHSVDMLKIKQIHIMLIDALSFKLYVFLVVVNLMN